MASVAFSLTKTIQKEDDRGAERREGRRKGGGSRGGAEEEERRGAPDSEKGGADSASVTPYSHSGRKREKQTQSLTKKAPPALIFTVKCQLEFGGAIAPVGRRGKKNNQCRCWLTILCCEKFGNPTFDKWRIIPII